LIDDHDFTGCYILAMERVSMLIIFIEQLKGCRNRLWRVNLFWTK